MESILEGSRDAVLMHIARFTSGSLLSEFLHLKGQCRSKASISQEQTKREREREGLPWLKLSDMETENSVM